MSDFALRARELSKQYRIGQLQSGHTVMRERLAWLTGGGRPSSRGASSIWALRDVSFDVAPGEVVGVIGQNGAGKSTLLKILSRITEPTSGYADVCGRVGSLLEVGTGFHQELTGRENVFLNGALLGMRRAEIAARFDEIVEFAGVSEFIDTPVKRYSSGMYVRLAFAVAAHLEPSILIVDEVLSVGDAEFQKRCLGKMHDVATRGRTVLFVSHNIQAIRSLCDRAVLLDGGHVALDGDAESVVRSYRSCLDAGEGARVRWDDPLRQPGDDVCTLVEVAVSDESGKPALTFLSSHPIFVSIEVDVRKPHPALSIGFELLSDEGACVFRSEHTDLRDGAIPALQSGRAVLSCKIPPGLLNAGRYRISPRVALRYIRGIAEIPSAVGFDVVFDHGESYFHNAPARRGLIAPTLSWRRVT